MKNDIHPKYYPEAEFKCVCGNKWLGGSTMEKVDTTICAKCHPFYTGTEKIVDTRGRVDKFKKRLEKSSAKASPKAKKAKS